MPHTSPYTSRSSRISAPSGTPGSPSGGGVAYSGSSRTLGSPCMNAFSPSAKVPSDVVDARFCSVMLTDDSSGVGQLRSISWMSGSLKTVHAPSGLGLVPSVCLLPAKDKARGDHPFTVFFSDHIRMRGVYDGHRLEIECSLPFGFDCFRKLRSVLGRKVFPAYLVGVPSTEVKFSMRRARLGRRNRRGSVFLAFSDVEASSLLPSFWMFIVLSPLVGIRSRSIVRTRTLHSATFISRPDHTKLSRKTPHSTVLLDQGVAPQPSTVSVRHSPPPNTQ